VWGRRGVLHVAWRDVRWPAPVCVRVCKRARAVVANARNIGIHCGGQAKPRTGSCDLELREKSTAILKSTFAKNGSWVSSRGRWGGLKARLGVG
jgi:hypothetical protein